MKKFLSLFVALAMVLSLFAGVGARSAKAATSDSVGIFRPSNNGFYLRTGTTVAAPIYLGDSLDKPIIGNWDGIGADEIGVFRPSNLAFFFRSSTGTVSSIFLGNSGDLPIIGDWNGDGTDEIGVFRPSTNGFYLKTGSTVAAPIYLGDSSDLPIIGDWDGNGTDEIGIFRPSNLGFYLRASNGTVAAPVFLGDSGDLPIIGNWDGLGADEIGIFRPSNLGFYLKTGTTVAAAIYLGNSLDKPIIGVWEITPPTYTVTFDSQGGSAVAAITGIASGATVTLPAAPTKALNTFASWNTAAAGTGTAFTASTAVTANITVYAQWASSDATLKATSTVKGQTVIGLGTANATLGSETAGTVTITAAKAADTSNLTTFITLFDPTNAGATVKVVKYASTAPTSGFATDTAYANQAITTADFFIVRVTAADGTTVLYYKVIVTVTPPSTDATLKVSSTVKGVALAGIALGTPDVALGSETAGAVTITAAKALDTSNLTTFVTLFDPTNAGATVKVVKYATGASTAAFATDTAYANQAITTADFFIVRVTAADGTTVLYYKVIVTVTPPSTDATLKVTSTVKGVALTTTLGTPNVVLSSATGGTVTITAAKALDTSNLTTFITLFDPTNAGATVKVVKYATGASTAGFATDAAYANQAITTADFFIVRVTAADLTTVLYYKVVVTVTAVSTDATLKTASTVKGQTVIGLGTPSAVLGSAAGGTVTITAAKALDTSNLTTFITLFDPTVTGAGVKVVKYATGASTAGFATDAAYANQAITTADFFIVRVTAADLTTVLYYKVVVTVTASATDATLKVTSTVKGVALTTTLGTPSAVLGSAAGGTVTITATQAADTTNAGSFITLFDPTVAAATVKVVKYATGASTATFGADAAYVGTATITTADFFIVRVIATDLTTVLYYKVVVTVTPDANNATLKAASTVKGVALTTSLGTPNVALGSETAGAVTITAAQAADTTNAGSFITLFDPTVTGAGVKVVKYATGASTATFGADAAYVGTATITTADFFIVRVIATDLTTVLYYKVVVTVTVADANNATLKAASTVKGVALTTSLGTPNVALGSETAGAVTITAAQAADTTNAGSFITLFDPTVTGAGVKVVKYATGASTATFGTDAAYVGTATITTADFFIVKVTATDGTTVLYYKVIVTVTPSTDATLKAASTVKGQTVIGLGTPSAVLGSAAGGTVTITAAKALDTSNLTTFITLFDPTDAAATVKVVKYTSAGSTAGFATDAAYANQAITTADFFIVRVTAADLTTVLYYKIVVTVTASATDATLKAASTVKGVTVIGLGTPNVALASATGGTVTIGAVQAADTTNAGSFITLFDPTVAAATVKVVKYASGATPAFGTDAAYANQAITTLDFFIVRVTATDGTTVLYYKVVVTVPAADAIATLKAASTIKGVTVIGLGTPNVALGSETAGAVTITAAKAADTTNLTTFITLFDPTNAQATVKVVKYATGASTATFGTDAAYANQAITTADFFIVKVTATDGTTVLYYKVIVTVTPSTDATLKVTSTVKGQTVIGLGTPNVALGSATGGTVTITAAKASDTSNLTTFITLFDPTDAAATVKVVKYATGASTATFGTDAAYANQAITSLDFFIVKVTATDGTTVLYYKVVVTVASTDATLKVTSTVKGQTVIGLGTPNVALGSATGGTVTITAAKASDTSNLTTFITLFDPTDAAATVKVVKYASAGSTAGFATDTAYANAAITTADFFIVQVIASDLTTVLYYKVVVTISG